MVVTNSSSDKPRGSTFGERNFKISTTLMKRIFNSGNCLCKIEIPANASKLGSVPAAAITTSGSSPSFTVEAQSITL